MPDVYIDTYIYIYIDKNSVLRYNNNNNINNDNGNNNNKCIQFELKRTNLCRLTGITSGISPSIKETIIVLKWSMQMDSLELKIL